MNLTRRAGFLILLFLMLGFALYAARLGSDASWDLRNYHLYDPFALLHHKFGFDIVPAQEQTFLAPQLDLIGYGVRYVLNSSPTLLNAVMSIPTAVATFLAVLITLLFLPPTIPGRLPLALIVALLGATGAAGLPTLATSSSESIPACFSLAGLLLVLLADTARRPALQLSLAGVLFGLAAGFKLTSLPFCIGGATAVLLSPLPSALKLRAFLGFAVMGVVGTALLAAPWWIVLAARYHNPLFPFFNQIFHSPDYLPLAMGDERFKPQGLLQAVFYPFYWAFSATPRVTEVPMRDPRFAVASVMIVGTLWRLVARSREIDRKPAIFLGFFAVSYLLWEKEFSIFRYLATIELISATAFIVAWRTFDPLSRRPALAWIGTLGLAVLCFTVTIYPDWGRAAPSPRAVNVVAPPLPRNALVILLDGAPMAYVAAFESPSIRFVGANNNIISPGQKSWLNAQGSRAIETAKGPLWGLSDPTAKTTDDQTLAAYHLHRAGICLPIISNIDDNSLQLCPLTRDP